MAAGAAGTIAKPQLRRLLETRLKGVVLGSCAFSVLVGIVWKYTVIEPRKKQYADFYKTYNPEKRLKIMCDSGYMQACGPE